MMEADQLITEIARTTGLRLDKADPILAAAVINEALLDRALVKLDRQVKIQADRVTAASTQAVLDAKKEAELLLTGNFKYIIDICIAAIEKTGNASASIDLTEIIIYAGIQANQVNHQTLPVISNIGRVQVQAGKAAPIAGGYPKVFLRFQRKRNTQYQC